MRSKRRISPSAWAFGGSLVVLACSLTAPSKDELFRLKGNGGESDDDGTSGSTSNGGSKSPGTAGNDGGTPAVTGGTSGQSGSAGATFEEGGAGATAGSAAGGMAGTSMTDAGEGGTGMGGGGAGPEAGSGGVGGEGGTIDYGPLEPGKGLVAHYKFDETDGTVVKDEIDGLDGTTNGAVTWVTGKMGGAVRLSGTAAYVDVPVTPLATLDEVTFALWFNPGTQTLWTRVLDIGSSQAHWMYFSPAAAPIGQGMGTHVALDIANQITAELHVTEFVPPVHTWTHVVISWSIQNFAYYINGQLAANDDTPDFTPSQFVARTPSSETLRAWLGRSSFTADAYFTGAIDDFRIYDRALPAPHAEALYELAE